MGDGVVTPPSTDIVLGLIGRVLGRGDTVSGALPVLPWASSGMPILWEGVWREVLVVPMLLWTPSVIPCSDAAVAIAPAPFPLSHVNEKGAAAAIMAAIGSLGRDALTVDAAAVGSDVRLEGRGGGCRGAIASCDG